MSDHIDQAQEAIARHAWSEAVALLSEASKQEELTAEEYEMLGLAAWWITDLKLCIVAREKAYALHMADANLPRAGKVALLLSENYYYENANAISAHWFRLAKEHLEKHPDSSAYGWYLRAEAHSALDRNSDPVTALKYANKALEVAKETRDRNLEFLCTHDIGRFSMALGNVEKGLDIMESTMVHVVSGEVEPFTTGKLFCNMIDVCDQLVDYRRATEWDSVARNWCERVGHSSGFPGICRVKRAGLMRRQGAWHEAEQEALKAKQELAHFTSFEARAAYEIGEIRLRMGDFEKAEQAFREAHVLGYNPQPGLALLYDAQGKTKAAFELLESTLQEVILLLLRVPNIAALGLLAAKLNKIDTARQMLIELSAIAQKYGSEAIGIAALNLQGHIAHSEREFEKAVDAFRKTLTYWLQAGLPYEAALARMYMAQGQYSLGRTELARLEWDTALREMERLGAKPDIERLHKMIASNVEPVSQTEKKAMMFTDIVGSTALIGIIGDAAWKHLVHWHDRTLRSLFETYHGREVNHTGDGFFVEFETANDAVYCACEIQRSLLSHRTKQGFAPNVRIGIHCAPVAHSGETLIGLEVHKAARIASLADASQVVASFEMTCDIDPSLLGERKSVTVKGIPEPIDVVMVEWKE